MIYVYNFRYLRNISKENSGKKNLVDINTRINFYIDSIFFKIY